MRRSLTAIPTVLLALSTLGACLPMPAAPPASEPETEVSRRATVTPTPGPSETAAAEGTPAPTATATPAPGPTSTPMGPSIAISGQVRVDAGYLVKAGVGSLVSSNGGSAIALRSGHLISGNGASLISDKGVGLIGKVKLISSNGGTLISDKGIGYRLLQAPAPGVMLPAQGMMVAPISLRTGEPIGPAVLTDASGGYRVQVPESQRDNVLILAAVPASREDDPILQDERMRYSLIAAPEAASQVIDEDTALVTRYMRIIFLERLHQILTTDDMSETERLADVYFAGAPALKTQLLAILKELRDAAEAVGVDALSPADQWWLAVKTADVLQAQLDLDTLMISSATYPDWTHPPEPAVAALASSFRLVRERAATLMDEDPTFFEAIEWLVAANTGRADPYAILRPSDVGDFLVRAYLTKNEEGVIPRTDALLTSIDAHHDALVGVDNRSRIFAVGNAFLGALVQALMFDQNGAKTEVLETIRAFEP